ncbi:hypothetical protein GCM10023094_25610 [Rhodococcus olei]|uniref:Uncharacterized protein n=1 Tax=Rhodococcus olei TaxID=2161675 RepID=A0ABP8P1E5_9NOCA
MRPAARIVTALAVALSLGLGTAAVATVAAGAAPAPAPTGPGDDPVFGLANGCYALRSEQTGSFTRLTPDGYRVDAAGPADAEAFRMHAAQLGRFMFYGRGGDLLAHDDAHAIIATRDATPATDWTLTHTDGGYSITATATGNQLTAHDGLLFSTDPGVDPAGGRFTLVPTTGCADFPDSEVNATGTPLSGTGPNGEVRGFIDAHVHLDANLFIGGQVHCGTPFDPQGITVALRDCADHGTDGFPALLENILSHGTPVAGHDTVG